MSALAKGANVALTKEIPNLSGIVVGVRWDAGTERVLAENLTLLTLLCGADPKVLSQEHAVYFNQLVSADLSTAQLEQAMGGDTEQVEVELSGVPAAVERIIFIVYVSEGSGANRNLGQLRDCTLRVLNLATGAQIISTVNLAAGLSKETALTLAEVYRHAGDWKFRVLGAGYSNGLAGVARDFGVAL